MWLLLVALVRSLYRSLLCLLCGPRRLPQGVLALEDSLDVPSLLASLQAALPPPSPSHLDTWLAPFLGSSHLCIALFSLPNFPFPLLARCM